MRSAAVVAALFAATALAGPIKPKRAYVTELTTVVVTQYVYVDAPAATGVAEQESETPEDHHVEVPVKQTSVAVPIEEPSAAPAPSPQAPIPSQAAPAPSPEAQVPSPEAQVPSPEAQAPIPSYVAPAPSPEAQTPSPEAQAPAPEPASEAPAPTYAEPEPAPTSAAAPVGEYEEKILYQHNVHRANHTVADLTWNADLANAANLLARTCVFNHNVEIGMSVRYGQNLAGSAPKENVTSSITEGWYNGEAPLYNDFYGREPDQDNFHGWGHFSQMVWKDTKEIGCATVDCTQSPFGMWYTVCNYLPGGNMKGAYAANVLQPRGDATARWNAYLNAH